MNRELIESYVSRNTSSKFELEGKVVGSYLDSLLNSDSIVSLLNSLKNRCMNGDFFWLYTSLWNTSQSINLKKIYPIVAYSMLKKDFTLFELINQILFTGTVNQYIGSDLSSDVILDTDEVPDKFTDSGNIFTDAVEGMIQIVYNAWFSTTYPWDPEGPGSEFQTFNELIESEKILETLMTIVKPARIFVSVLYQPYCFLSGDKWNVKAVGLEAIMSPFGLPSSGPNTSIDIIKSMSDRTLMNCYRHCEMRRRWTDILLPLQVDRTVIREEGFLTFRYIFRTEETVHSDKLYGLWGDIKITASTEDITWVQATQYEQNMEYYEGYLPLVLKLYDDENSPVLALDVNTTTDESTAALFYAREIKEI